MGRSNPSGHPARFSASIIDCLKTKLQPGDWVHDPFAGTGEFLGELADEIGFIFSGTEIEPSLIVDHRVDVGDSIDPRTYPRVHGWIGCTSPVYPNGVADYFASSEKEAKPWQRNTYRHAVAKRTGGQQTWLMPNNMGQFGYRGTQRGESDDGLGRSLRRQAYWDLARRCVVNWREAQWFYLNVSDFVYNDDQIEPVTADWIKLMEANEWSMFDIEYVETPRYLNASDGSRDNRMDAEAVVTFRRPVGYSPAVHGVTPR